MRVESPYKVYLEDYPVIDIPRPTKIPSTDEFIKGLEKAVHTPEYLKGVRERALWRAQSARKDVVFGGPGCGMCNDYGPNAPRF